MYQIRLLNMCQQSHTHYLAPMRLLQLLDQTSLAVGLMAKKSNSLVLEIPTALSSGNVQQMTCQQNIYLQVANNT